MPKLRSNPKPLVIGTNIQPKRRIPMVLIMKRKATHSRTKLLARRHLRLEEPREHARADVERGDDQQGGIENEEGAHTRQGVTWRG